MMTGQKLHLPWWCMGKSTNLLFCMAKVTKKKKSTIIGGLIFGCTKMHYFL